MERKFAGRYLLFLLILILIVWIAAVKNGREKTHTDAVLVQLVQKGGPDL